MQHCTLCIRKQPHKEWNCVVRRQNGCSVQPLPSPAFVSLSSSVSGYHSIKATVGLEEVAQRWSARTQRALDMLFPSPFAGPGRKEWLASSTFTAGWQQLWTGRAEQGDKESQQQRSALQTVRHLVNRPRREGWRELQSPQPRPLLLQTQLHQQRLQGRSGTQVFLREHWQGFGGHKNERPTLLDSLEQEQ